MAQNNTLTKIEGGLIESYHLDTLGAPFKVVLKNCVSRTIDPRSGEEKIEYPDPVGLVMAVIRCRVLDPRRMSGDDLIFVRKSLGIKAIKIAEFLDMSPEHYSRCETGVRALSAASEKQLRLFAFCASLFNNAETLLDQREAAYDLPEPVCEKSRKQAERFLKIFLSMKIAPQLRMVNDEEPQVEYVFSRRAASQADIGADCPDDDGDWMKLKVSNG